MIIHRINFPFYGLFIVLSIFIGIFYIYKNLKREGIENKYIFYYALLFIPFAFVFGKLYTIVVNFNSGVNLLTAGLSSYGGLLGVVIASIIFEYIKPSKKLFIKYTILSLPLVYGVSKMACTIAGCCHGIPYNGPLAVNYIDLQDQFLFPVQFLEVVLNILLFMVLNRFKNNKNIVYITMIVTAIVKFLTDFLRYEHINTMITPNQIFSILLIITVIIVMIVLNNKKTKDIRHSN